jgi:hypothetical protein
MKGARGEGRGARKKRSMARTTCSVKILQPIIAWGRCPPKAGV